MAMGSNINLNIVFMHGLTSYLQNEYTIQFK